MRLNQIRLTPVFWFAMRHYSKLIIYLDNKNNRIVEIQTYLQAFQHKIQLKTPNIILLGWSKKLVLIVTAWKNQKGVVGGCGLVWCLSHFLCSLSHRRSWLLVKWSEFYNFFEFLLEVKFLSRNSCIIVNFIWTFQCQFIVVIIFFLPSLITLYKTLVNLLLELMQRLIYLPEISDCYLPKRCIQFTLTIWIFPNLF